LSKEIGRDDTQFANTFFGEARRVLFAGSSKGSQADDEAAAVVAWADVPAEA
jgi:hypothetical protein